MAGRGVRDRYVLTLIGRSTFEFSVDLQRLWEFYVECQYSKDAVRGGAWY